MFCSYLVKWSRWHDQGVGVKPPREAKQGRQRERDEEGFLIPPCSPQWRRSPASPAPGICGFTIADFHLGAAPADTASRQSLGMHHPNLHNCGVNDCPFSLSSPSLIARARAQGVLLQRTGSPTDHAKVDHRAFPDLVQVKVRAEGMQREMVLLFSRRHCMLRPLPEQVIPPTRKPAPSRDSTQVMPDSHFITANF